MPSNEFLHIKDQASNVPAIVGSLNLYKDFIMDFTQNLKEISKHNYKDFRDKLTSVQCQTRHMYGAI